MPTYAILGATGFTGRCLVSQLLSTSSSTPKADIKLNLYARSKAKLSAQNIGFEKDVPENVQLFIGELGEELVNSVVWGTDVVFCVLATNESRKGCCIAQDQAHAVLSALRTIRDSSSPPPTLPHLVILSAAPVSSVFSHHIPAPVSWLLWRCLNGIYSDLQASERLLRVEKEWVPATFVYPGGLSNIGDPTIYGHKVVTSIEEMHEVERTAGNGGTFMSYGDLAAGMIEIVDDESSKYEWVDTSVVPTGEGGKMEWWSWGRMMVEGVVFGG